jgi:hypothetical protein
LSSQDFEILGCRSRGGGDLVVPALVGPVDADAPRIEPDNFRFPLATCLLLGLALSLAVWLIRLLRGWGTPFVA